MAQPLSLDQVANEMRDRQAHPGSNKSSQTVWDADTCMFVQLSPGETPKANQNPLSILPKEPYFA